MVSGVEEGVLSLGAGAPMGARLRPALGYGDTLESSGESLRSIIANIVRDGGE